MTTNLDSNYNPADLFNIKSMKDFNYFEALIKNNGNYSNEIRRLNIDRIAIS